MNMKLAEEHGQGMIQEELVGDNGGKYNQNTSYACMNFTKNKLKY